jgi:hypothetical protein
VSAPATDLVEHLRQLAHDAAEVAAAAPPASGDAQRQAKIMDRLAEECAEAP